MMRKKQIHLYLDDESVRRASGYVYIKQTYKGTANLFLYTCEQVHTTIPHFLSWGYGRANVSEQIERSERATTLRNCC